MKTVKWGIIGCGDVTEKKSGPAFNKIDHSQLIAVMRRNAEKAKDYSQRHGVSKWFSDARQLIEDEDVNAIYVATPPLYHEEFAVFALKAGKPVYLEKPMAVSLAAAENIMTVSQQTGTKLSVAHYRRQQPLFKKIKTLIDTNEIGDIRLINLQLFQSPQPGLVAKTETNWRVDPVISGGGLFHDLAPHQLDLMLYFFGMPVEASGISLNQAGSYKADDLVTGYIRFKKNIIFNGIWSFAVSPGNECDNCEIVGSEGSVRFSTFKQEAVVFVQNGITKTFEFEPLQHVQQPMIESVVAYFLDKGPNPCSAAEGVETMRLIENLTKNTHKNQTSS